MSTSSSSSKTFTAEIVAIGSELTSGAKQDRHGQWLSDQLSGVGITTHYHQTVDDGLQRMIDVFRVASERSDLVLITGGLGPTLDDLTRQALAGLADVELIEDSDSLKHLEAFFERRGRTMPDRNRIQAMFPQGSEPLLNPIGTAPGIWLALPRANQSPCLIGAMPGVPSEMHRMFREQVVPRLPGSDGVIQRARVNCFGRGESDIEQTLGELTARDRNPEVGITAHEATITLRIEARGQSVEECQSLIADAKAEVRERLGVLVFGEEDDELEDVLLRRLKANGKTLSTIECGTGGHLADRITEVSGHDDVFLGGVIVPSWGVADRLLGESFVPVESSSDESLTERLAHAVRDRTGSDYALAISPKLEGGNRMVVAIAGADVTRSQEVIRVGNPAIQNSRTAKVVMNLLRLHLIDSPCEA